MGVWCVAGPLAFSCMAFSVQLVGTSWYRACILVCHYHKMYKGTSTKGKGTLA